jgi:hypothetical protein
MQIDTVLELREISKKLSESLELSESQVKNFINILKRSNDLLLENIIRKMQELTSFEYFLYRLENSYLNKLNIGEVKKWKDINSDEWDFLSKEETLILNNLKKYYNSLILGHQLAKAELLSLRKDIHLFIEKRLEEIKKFDESEKITKLLIGEYLIEDSIRELGYKIEDGELIRLKLQENFMYK